MKKVTAAILGLTLMLSLAACGGGESASSAAASSAPAAASSEPVTVRGVESGRITFESCAFEQDVTYASFG